MTNPAVFAELWRGDILESVHYGHAVICDEHGDIIQSWGDPNAIIYPRSSCKMIQALPLIESGAADAYGLTDAQLALACASHQGAAIHTNPVADWLADLGLAETDLRCGPQNPPDKDARNALIKTDESPCQLHNNCSGKHAGFLTLNQHLKGDAEYIDPSHPVQTAIKSAFEDTTDETSPGFGIDGCSAPNHATTVHGLARSMSFFATAHLRGDTRSNAAQRLTQAMIAFPELVAGETRACTELMRAMDGKAAIKTGAEGVYVAIIPEQKIGIALKATDGSTRAAECAIAVLLVKQGVLNPTHPATLKRMNKPELNRRGLHAATLKPAPALL